jgi:hypothetical protein
VLAGANLPWFHYGCDFGRNKWDSHIGVSTHAEQVRASFAAMASAGVEVVRWFVFTDGRGGLVWSAFGELEGLDAACLTDMDAALGIAGAAGVRLCLALLDFAWLDDPARRLALLDRDGSSAFLDRVIEPMLDRVGGHHAIHSIDIINEPDWVIRELAIDRARAAWPLQRLCTFVAAASERIRSRSHAQITLGGGLVKHAREWDRPDYGLDFVQVHAYPHQKDLSVFEHTASWFGLSKPLLIGECPAQPFEDYQCAGREGGYLGVWPWSVNGVDEVGAVDLRMIRERGER